MIKDKRIKHTIQQHLDDLAPVFEKHHQVIAAYLFGSHAKGTAGPLSDVDIAYLLDENVKSRKMEEVGNILYASITACLRTDEISFVCLNEAPVSVRYAVVSSGKVIYCADEAKRIEFEESTMHMYIDTRHIREEYYKYLFEKIREDKFGHRYQ